MTKIQLKQGWQEVKLGEITETVTKGTTPSSMNREFKKAGINYIKSESITKEGFIDQSNFAFIDEETNQILKRSIIKENDILFSIAGMYLAKSAIVRKKHLPANTNQAVGIIRLNHDISNFKFVNYCFSSNDFVKRVYDFKGQAAQPNISLGDIKSLTIILPPLPIQNKIAEILGNYDDLIEANNRRIKILETQAAKIYTEWFMHYRYPGHESVPLVDSGTDFGTIPQGWEVRKVGEVVLIKKGKNITKDTITEGVVPVVAGGLTPAYYHNKANTLKPVITISASGANAGFVNFYFQDIWASDCSYIDNNSTKFIYFYYLLMKEKQTIISSLQKGSAQPHVYPKDLMEISYLDPSIEIKNKFENHASSLFIEIANLQQQNQNLKKSRDLLIPRLVGGLLEV